VIFRRGRFLPVLASLILPLAAQTPSPVDIIRKSVEIDRRNWQRAKDYTFLQQVERREYGRDGKLKSSESQTFDVLILDGTPYERKIAVDGKPLSAKEAQKVQREFDKERARRLSETPAQRQKRLSAEESAHAKTRAFALEIPDAFTFTLIGQDTLEGQPVWIIDAEPKPGFRGKAPHSDLLPKFRGRVWVEQKDFQWVKMEAQTIAPVSFGWFLARLAPGAVITFRQTRINSEIWLPRQVQMRLDARLALLKKFSGEIEVNFRDYRKFQTDSRLVPDETAPRP